MAHMHFFSDFPRLLGNEGTAAVPGAALEEEVEIWVFSLLVLKQLEDIKVKMSDKRLCMWIRISEKKKKIWIDEPNLEIITIWLQLQPQLHVSCL